MGEETHRTPVVVAATAATFQATDRQTNKQTDIAMV